VRAAAVAGVALVAVSFGSVAPAGAAIAPVASSQLLVTHEAVAPLVVRHDDSALSLAAPGLAVVGTGTGEVLVAANLTFAGADRASGVVLAHGPSGDLRVLVERDGTDQAVAVHLTDGVGGDSLLASVTVPGGLPGTVQLRVEQHSGVLRAWLDGTLVIDRPLTAPEVVLMVQNDHGTIVDHAGDSVSAAWVLART
jgi:hypothetical protein